MFTPLYSEFSLLFSSHLNKTIAMTLYITHKVSVYTCPLLFCPSAQRHFSSVQGCQWVLRKAEPEIEQGVKEMY